MKSFDRFFSAETKAIEALEVARETISGQIEEMTEEYSTEDGYFAAIDKLSKATVQKRFERTQRRQVDGNH